MLRRANDGQTRQLAQPVYAVEQMALVLTVLRCIANSTYIRRYCPLPEQQLIKTTPGEAARCEAAPLPQLPTYSARFGSLDCADTVIASRHTCGDPPPRGEKRNGPSRFQCTETNIIASHVNYQME